MADTDHIDIRWNPDLQEWFCAACGVTSDHAAKQDAAQEMAAFDCTLQGTSVARLEKERLLRAHYLTKKRKE